MKNLTSLLEDEEGLKNLNGLPKEETIISDIADQSISADLDIADLRSTAAIHRKDESDDPHSPETILEEIFGEDLDKDTDPDFVLPEKKIKVNHLL